jgi:tRNA threonylcarbamoyladenosine biosynthesis protein TsaB
MSTAVGLKVLAIDTSTEACSAAVLVPDGQMISRFVLTERSHADLILPMVDEVLRESGLALADLDGLAFGRGPGGFTGLRIAAGVIHGLAFGAGLKVAPVSSLAAVAYQVGASPQHFSFEKGVGARSAGEVVPAAGEGILVCNDARMKELYWACYRFDPAAPALPVQVTAERVSPSSAIEVPAGIVHVAGNGVERYPELRARLEAAGLQFHAGLYPHAAAIAHLGAGMLQRGEGVAAADALPTYVRDDVARPSSHAAVTGMS